MVRKITLIGFSIICSFVMLTCQSSSTSSKITFGKFQREIDSTFKLLEKENITIQVGWDEALNSTTFFEELNDWLIPVPIGDRILLVRQKPSGLEENIFNKADSLYHVREYQRARDNFEKVIQMNPYNWYAYLYLGDTFFIWDQLDTAQFWFSKAISINPHNWKSWKYDADLQYTKGDMEKGTYSAVRSIALNPYNIEPQATLSFITMETQKKYMTISDTTIYYWDELSKKVYLRPTIHKSDYELQLLKYGAAIYGLAKNSETLPIEYEGMLENLPYTEKHMVGSYEKALKQITTIWKESGIADPLGNKWFTHLSILEANKKLTFFSIWTEGLRYRPRLGLYLSESDLNDLVNMFIEHHIDAE